MRRRIFVAVTNDLATDQRVNKVCHFLYENGYEVILIGRKLKKSLPVDNLPYRTVRFKLLFNRGFLFYACYNIRLFFYLLLRKKGAILSNDLDTLLACTYIKVLFRKHVLYYDAHEFFTEVPEVINRKKVQRIWKKIERFCLPKVDVFYTVNDSLAQLYLEKTGVKPLVVRNVSPEADPFVFQLKRGDIGLKVDDFVVILQGAGINVDRGAEEAVDAILQLDGVILCLVGDGDVIPFLKEKVKKNNWGEKIRFYDKQPYNKLIQFTHLADLGLSLDKDTNVNYKFSLPNKIFDYIHAGVPVLASDLPEVKNIIKKYDVGVITPEVNAESIRASIVSLKNNQPLLEKLKSNCKVAAKELNWKNEIKVLREIYLKEQ